MKREYIAIRLEFTPNHFCIRGVDIISHRRKMGVKTDCEKNIHFHILLWDLYFILEYEGTKIEKLPF